ncbi:uncharacterized protein with PIN domain [Azospirillum soli]|nr:uncharacterized protein with PIN domain [Azospirillum soli]
MLGRLARLLRAAGYDTRLADGGTPDRVLLEQARAEGRILLTRDRRLAESAGAQGWLLNGEGLEEQAHALGDAFRVDWLNAPFSRCLVDNTPVRPASPDELSAIPPGARPTQGPFNSCPACGRLYWPGSHVRRLAGTLQRLAHRHGTQKAPGAVDSSDATKRRC